MSDRAELTKVGIVGAGPVGMALAARLAQFGIASVIFERSPGPRRQGSKACLIQGDALEVLDKLGIGQEIAARGLAWSTGHTYVRGQEVRRDEHPQRIGFGPFVNISQWDVECALRAHLEAEPSCSILWGHQVVGYRELGDAVHVTTRDGQGTERDHEMTWVVGCDGVRSAMRDLAPVTWSGYTHRDRFLITDLRCALPLAKERHFHYDPPFNPGRQVVMHPQPDDVWRIDWQLPPDADVEAEVASGEFDRRVRRVVGDVPYEVEWRSTYRFHQRVVDRFVVGRVLLAGDAAHAFPPYGSRGMNSGFQDADNLAWKLALVARGDIGDDLLETYHRERRAAAEDNLAVTEHTLRFMVPPTRWHHLWRRLVLAASRLVPRVARRVDSGQMATPFRYTSSPIVKNARPVDGSLAPDGFLDGVIGRRRLRTLLGHDFVLLRFPGTTSDAGHRVEVVSLGELGPASESSWTDPDGNVGEAFGLPERSWALIRPDGHVAATGLLADLDLAHELVSAKGGAAAAAAPRPAAASVGAGS